MIQRLKHLRSIDIDKLHLQVLRFGGLPGFRADVSLASLTGRIDSSLFYGEFDNVESVAILYAEVIARGHFFNDANKRTALYVMVTFLSINGIDLRVDNKALADQIIALAAGQISRQELTDWLLTKS